MKRSRTNQVLFEDTECAFLSEDDDLLDEASQIFMENPIDFDEVSQIFAENPMPLPLYYRVGSGFENAEQPMGAGLPFVAGSQTSRLEQAIIFRESLRRRNDRFQAEEIHYEARVDPDRLPADVRDVPMVAAVHAVRELFEILIRRATEGLAPTDLIRVCIRAEGLDKPISTCIMTVRELTVEKIMAAVLKVLQSKEQIQLDVGFLVNVITIINPVGAGRRKIANIAVDRLQKQCIFAIPSDEEGLCCAKAIVFAKAHLENDKRAINTLRNLRRPALMTSAQDLHKAARVPLGPCTFREIAQFEEHLNIQIAVLSSDNRNRVVYKGAERQHGRRINLWLHDGHYDVVKSLKAFFGSSYYCERCDVPYNTAHVHRCPDACYVCQQTDCRPGQPQRCQDCDRLCQSSECFTAHKAVTGNQQLSICDEVYQCRKCCKIIRRRDCSRDMHRCGTAKCPSCCQYVVTAEHYCYLKKVSPKTPSDNLIFFDFETDQSSGTHEVNFAVAQYADGTEEVFKGYTACADFCTWLFTPRHKGYTAIAHNMKGFDGQFIMEWMLRQGTTPDVIPCGGKLMSIRLASHNISIIDSLNFLPMALSRLPSSFGLSELKKGYFPHLFNTRENQTYVGPLPEPLFYSPDTMAPAARQAFLSWHEEHKGDVFDFQAEMLSYCRSDVDILRRSCLEFRAQFMEIADVDPFRYVTIASVCMAAFRSNHILPDTIAMVPVHGYINRTNFSPDSIRWLDFESFSQGVHIQHALNGTGERKIAGVSVDGFCEETNTIYQYQGCFFHGCSTCYNSDLMHPLKCVTMASLRQQTEESVQKLRARGYTVIEMWEHAFQELKRKSQELKGFLETHAIKDRLNPRDSFFGGRTNAVKLLHKGTIKYVDFTSLYPWVNKYCTYPVGHPTIITEGFGDMEEYFGIIQCRVIPPRGLYLPVLPYRCQKKLMFPLCRTCAEHLQQSPCTHTDDERALVGTWVSEEVKLAKKKGYQITHIYEVYHFDKRSDQLFRSFIDQFLKIKQESSGWPTECVTEDQKAQYIRQYEEREGVKLDPASISKNPGRRQVAKLALNSFWGRWGMNINKDQLTFVKDVSKFNKMLNDPTKEIKDVFLPTPEIAAIQTKVVKDFVEQDTSTNIFIASFTTAWARLKLYSEMDKLGDSVLYHDTDSIIYASNGVNDPPLGNFLGEFTDELDGETISTFVSGGPKNYAYQTCSGKTVCKVRGFTLNFRNSLTLNFDSVRALVTEMDPTKTIALHNPAKITRDVKKRKVINKEETKLYRVVYDKRVIQPDLTTLPYGY